MLQESDKLIEEAFELVKSGVSPAQFDTRDKLSKELEGVAKIAVTACFYLGAQHLGQAKFNELERAFSDAKKLSFLKETIKRTNRTAILLRTNHLALNALAYVYPGAKGETNKMAIKSGTLNQGNLSVKKIKKNERGQYAGILPIGALKKETVLIQPLVTVSHGIKITSWSNSRTPLTATIHHSAMQYIQPTQWGPSLDLAYSPRLVWSSESASILKITDAEIKFHANYAHLLIADAMQNPYDGAAFSNEL